MIKRNIQELCDTSLREIFDIEGSDRVPVIKEELYLLLSFYGISQKNHKRTIEKSLENNNVQLRDKSERLPRYVIDRIQVRAYLLWKINDDWKLPNQDNNNTSDFEQRKTQAIELKFEINNRKIYKKKIKSSNVTIIKMNELEMNSIISVKEYSYVNYYKRIYNKFILSLVYLLNLVY